MIHIFHVSFLICKGFFLLNDAVLELYIHQTNFSVVESTYSNMEF